MCTPPFAGAVVLILASGFELALLRRFVGHWTEINRWRRASEGTPSHDRWRSMTVTQRGSFYRIPCAALLAAVLIVVGLSIDCPTGDGAAPKLKGGSGVGAIFGLPPVGRFTDSASVNGC